MADCKRKTANLFFDKLIGMTWWDGVITADERFTLHIAEVKPNTTYTASGNNSVDNIMVTYYSVYPAEGQSSVESVRYVYPTNPTRSVATFTTPDDSRIKYAAVRFGSDAADVMFNLGSTALPYEPYGWVHSLRKLSTDTDTITTLPAVLYPNDTTATVGLKGQAVQSTTPTPDNPIMPQGTGERTGNLWYEDYTGISPSIKYVPILVGDGTFTLSSTTPLPPNGAACLFFFAGNVDSGAGPQNRVYDENPRTLNSIDGYVTIAYRITSYDPRDYQTMLNTGSTPLPYEPYGYKLDISSGNTTTPIYLGEVETTRKIKKLVLTGEENDWRTSGDGAAQIFNHTIGLYADLQPYAICNMFYRSNNAAANNNSFDIVRSSGNGVIRFNNSGIASTVAAWKSYLQQQYAAGTPVTVWYVLATEETGIVNEPLMKIGNYADEVSNISIPVTAGGDTLSVDTTVQPSEVTAMYRGWHPVQSAHEKSRNLFDKSTIEVGGIDINTGEEVANNSRRRSGFIKVAPSMAYTLRRELDTSNRSNLWIIGYDANKNVISDGTGTRSTVLASIAESSTVSAFDTTPSTEYLRWYVTANGSYSNIMLNEGSTALPYEPYWN